MYYIGSRSPHGKGQFLGEMGRPTVTYCENTASATRLLPKLLCDFLLILNMLRLKWLTHVGRSQLLARWPGTHSRILSGIQRAAQTVLGVYSKRTCSRITSASSALGVLNDYALYKSTHSLTHCIVQVIQYQKLCLNRHKQLKIQQNKNTLV